MDSWENEKTKKKDVLQDFVFTYGGVSGKKFLKIFGELLKEITKELVKEFTMVKAIFGGIC